jgi:hypothetical protein
VSVEETLLDEAEMDAFGQQLSIHAAINLAVGMKLRNRTLLEWLFKPPQSIKGKI